MADIVNLRRARKQRKRDEHDRQAAENRLAFGRSKLEKDRDAAERQLRERHLSGHRRDGGKDDLSE